MSELLRVKAFEALLRILNNQDEFWSEFSNSKDRALQQEIVLGTIRFWFFFEDQLKHFAKKSVKKKLKALAFFSAYQVVFLDRIPLFAVSDQLKQVGLAQKFSNPEISFAQAFLQQAFQQKAEWALLANQQPWYPSSIVDLLTWLTPDLLESNKSLNQKKQLARTRAESALKIMQTKPSLQGYVLDSTAKIQTPHQKITDFAGIAALEFSAGGEFFTELNNFKIRVQSCASQQLCSKVAQLLLADLKSKKNLTLFEFAMGKGGKTLSTLMRLAELAQQNKFDLAKVKIKWVGVEPSSQQQLVFTKEVMPYLKEHFKFVDLAIVADASELSAKADWVWVDAPCSGLGTLSKLPQIALRLAEKGYETAQRLAKVQTTLLEQAFSYLNEKGSWIYSVCTLTKPETIDVISALQAKHQQLTIADQNLIWPHLYFKEGFFWCLGAKTGGVSTSIKMVSHESS